MRCWSVVVALCLCGNVVLAGTERGVRSVGGTELYDVDPAGALETALVRDATDNTLDQHDLISAVLIAGGCDEPLRLERLQIELQDWLSTLPSVDPNETLREQSERNLCRMHRDLLTGSYRAECSDLAQLIEHGNFNCVGATVVYLAACETCGLTAKIQEIPGHVRCQVWLGDRWEIVEPTCREWFTLANDPSQLELIALPAELKSVWRDPSAGRELAQLGLVAMVYYNRGLDRLEQRDWAGAVAANQLALRLDPASRSARANLLAIWNNWALQRSAAGEHAAAEAMLERGLAIAPEFNTFRLNLGIVRERRGQ